MLKKGKKALSLLLSTALVVSGLSIISGKVQAEGEEGYGLSNPRIAYNTRETVIFGSYWQEDTNGDGVADENDEKQPIVWQVLEKYDDGTALVMSDKILDFCKYYKGISYGEGEIDYSCTWETSTVRNWLNINFYNNAFSINEKEAIIETDVVNDDNLYRETEGGNNTNDNVFLLSLDEIKNTAYGFDGGWYNSDQARVAKGTTYAKHGSSPTDSWWLRSPGESSAEAAYVGPVGYVHESGDNVYWKNYGIRPALRIKLSSSYVKVGEKVKISVKGSEWDTVTFGRYGGKDISWRVLNVSGDNAFLVSDEILTTKAYNDEETSVTWKDSTIRKWLNEDFLNSSFSDVEKEMIMTSVVINNDNDNCGTEGGEDTADKIFLLSLDDIKQPGYGFPDQSGYNSKTRVAKNSAGETDYWWLRSPGLYTDDASFVSTTGCVYDYGNVDDTYGGIRPALRINLSYASAWKKGEKVVVGDVTDAETNPIDPDSRTSIPVDDDSVLPTPTPSSEPTPSSSPNPISTPTVKPVQIITPSPKKDKKEKAPTKPTIKKAKIKKGKMLYVKWKKVKKAKGYEVQYALNKKFTKSKKNIYTTKTSVTLKKLKKKTYYVRVRTYTLSSKGELVFSKWSKVKKVKVKK
ncbi:hypothetical protein SAMN06297422_11490 [Lachnospiraceae bacterium]|nr:hypothetical protein SAMN06297422_11490 [Lachnospiraceae bacterium]